MIIFYLKLITIFLHSQIGDEKNCIRSSQTCGHETVYFSIKEYFNAILVYSHFNARRRYFNFYNLHVHLRFNLDQNINVI